MFYFFLLNTSVVVFCTLFFRFSLCFLFSTFFFTLFSQNSYALVISSQLLGCNFFIFCFFFFFGFSLCFLFSILFFTLFSQSSYALFLSSQHFGCSFYTLFFGFSLCFSIFHILFLSFHQIVTRSFSLIQHEREVER